MPIYPFNGIMPKIHPTAFIAPGAVIIGDVEIGEGSSIWFGCVVRADTNSIRIGARTNIQDGTVIHVASSEELVGADRVLYPTGYPTLIGDDVTVGHMALLHGCVLEDKAFVAMKAIVMDGAKVLSHGVLGAGALLPPGKVVGKGELWLGSPAGFRRKLTDDDLVQFGARAGQYHRLASAYEKGLAT